MDEGSPKRGKILVIRGGAIGDFVLTLPALAALRSAFPDTEIHLLGYPHIARLALLAGSVDQVQSIEAQALASFFGRATSLDAGLARYFAQFALVLSYLYDPDQIFEANLKACGKVQFIAGPHRPSEEPQALGLPAPAARQLLKPLEKLAIFDADPIPKLPPGPERPRSSAGLLRIAVHPGSGSPKKNWPEESWRQLLARLSKQFGVELVLVGGEAEEGRVERLARELPGATVLTKLPLTELAARLGQCAYFLGHDSGISHLAAAVGVPCLLLWGESNSAVWQPPHARVRLIKAGAQLKELSVETVWEELGHLFLSRPGT